MKVVTLGQDDEVLARKSAKLKFEAGQTYRVSIASVPGLADGKPDFEKGLEFTVTSRFYCKALKCFVQYEGPEYDRFLGTDSVKTYGVAPVILWPNVSKSLPPEVQLQVMLAEFSAHLWMVPGNSYRDLRTTAINYPLNKRDLSISCSDGQYQKISMLPLEDSMLVKLFAKRGAAIIDTAIDRILAELKTVHNEMGRELGRKLSIRELDAAISGGTVAPTGGAAQDSQRRAAMPTSADLDNLLQSMNVPAK